MVLETHVLELKEGQARLEEQVQAGRQDTQGVREEVRLLKEHQIVQNGSVNDMKLKWAAMTGANAERQRWEEKESRRWAFRFTGGLALAGLLSGIVFGIMDAVTK